MRFFFISGLTGGGGMNYTTETHALRTYCSNGKKDNVKNISVAYMPFNSGILT